MKEEKITKGNVDDRASVLELTKNLVGTLYADKGYIKQNLFVTLKEKILLRKRTLIETVFGYLKNTLNIEHSRHRSPVNAFVNILAALVAYSLKKNKPSIKFNFHSDFNNSLIQN